MLKNRSILVDLYPVFIGFRPGNQLKSLEWNEDFPYL